MEKLKLNNDQFIFHAGTKLFENKFMAIGGRVLNIVVTSNNFNECKNKAIKILEDINWSKGFYRKDIGYKVVSQWELFLVNLKIKKYYSLQIN